MDYTLNIKGQEFHFETLKLTIAKIKQMSHDPIAAIDIISELITPSIDNLTIEDLPEITDAIKKAITLMQKKTK